MKSRFVWIRKWSNRLFGPSKSELRDDLDNVRGSIDYMEGILKRKDRQIKKMADSDQELHQEIEAHLEEIARLEGRIEELRKFEKKYDSSVKALEYLEILSDQIGDMSPDKLNIDDYRLIRRVARKAMDSLSYEFSQLPMPDHSPGYPPQDIFGVPSIMSTQPESIPRKDRDMKEVVRRMSETMALKHDIIGLSVLRDYLGGWPPLEDVYEKARMKGTFQGTTIAFLWEGEVLCEWTNAHLGVDFDRNWFFDKDLNIHYRLEYREGPLDFMSRQDYYKASKKLKKQYDENSDS